MQRGHESHLRLCSLRSRDFAFTHQTFPIQMQPGAPSLDSAEAATDSGTTRQTEPGQTQLFACFLGIKAPSPADRQRRPNLYAHGLPSPVCHPTLLQLANWKRKITCRSIVISSRPRLQRLTPKRWCSHRDVVKYHQTGHRLLSKQYSPSIIFHAYVRLFLCFRHSESDTREKRLLKQRRDGGGSCICILKHWKAFSDACLEREVNMDGKPAHYRLYGVWSYQRIQSCVRPTSQSFAAASDLFVLWVQWTEPMAAVTVWWWGFMETLYNGPDSLFGVCQGRGFVTAPQLRHSWM